MSPPTADRTSLAIALTLAAMAAFAVMDGLSKLLLETLPIAQVMWVRNIVFTLVAVAILRWQQPGRRLRDIAGSQRPGLQFARGLLLMIESAMFMLAFRMLPIADVHAVAAAAPLVVVALSVPFLGEKVGPRRWAAVLVGFLGVLLIVRPGSGTMSAPMLVALAGAALWAVYQILVRLASRSDSAATTSLWTALVGLGATSVIGPLSWIWPDAQSWALLLTIALLGSVAHAMLIAALGMTNAVNIQPYTYTLFVWAVVVGYVMFGHMPDRWTLSGAGIIIASGLYVWYRERVRAAEATRMGVPDLQERPS
jgi:drug/metabolite transporter (DMT)-like permease